MNKVLIHLRRWVFMLILCSLSVNFTLCQTDTGKTLPEVIVTDSGPESFMYGVRQDVIDSVYLRNHSTQSMSDVLSEKTNAYLRSYGNGMLSSISFRGTGSERTNIVWNGFSINYPNLGTGDFSVYPSGAFNSVRLQHGASSANFGNASLGGSLILGFQPSWKKCFSIKLQQEYGSYNTWLTGMRASYGTTGFQGQTFFQRSSSTNNFAYRDLTAIGFPVKETVNAAYEQYSLIQDLFFRKGIVTVDLHGWYNRMNRQIPPAMGAANTNARELDQSIRVAAGINLLWKWGKTRISGAWFQDEINYRDDGLADSSLVHTIQAQVEQDLFFVKNWTFKIGGQIQYFIADQSFYQGIRKEPRGAAFVLVNFTPFRFLRFSYSVRQQFLPGSLPPLTGRIGMEWDFFRKKSSKNDHVLTWNVNISNGYRVLTLNDRFWIPGGSDTILPEYSWSFEAGFNYKVTRSRSAYTFGITGYYGWVNNWIQWQPTPMGYWAPKNIGKVALTGLEGNFGWSWNNKGWSIASEVLYALTYALDQTGSATNGNQLMYVPLHTINGNIQVGFKGFFLQAFARYTGARNVRADESKWLDPYFLINFTAGKDFHTRVLDIGLSVKVQNTTATNYQTIENRPMPGINYLAGLTVGFNSSHIKSKRIK